MKLRDRIASLKQYLGPKYGGVFVPPTVDFPHDKWAEQMIQDIKKTMGNIAMEPPQPEPVCPITKALIVQQLGDLALKHPGVSIREILNTAMQDGVKDDYELAAKLDAVSKIIETRGTKTGMEIMIRHKYATKRLDDLQDSMSYMMRGLLDNVALANNPPVVTRDPSAGSSDPADKSGSSSG